MKKSLSTSPLIMKDLTLGKYKDMDRIRKKEKDITPFRQLKNVTIS